MAHRWAALKERFATLTADDLTAWQTAGLRRALVLYAAFNEDGAIQCRHEVFGLRWARARAWLGISWTCGLRMASDTTNLLRGQIRPDLEGRGWSITLGSTKDDAAARKAVTRFFEWPERGIGVAPLLAEYLCVRDALVGDDPDGAFIVDVFKTRRPQPLVKPVPVATRDLELLAKLAGVEPVFSSYSTRKGYCAQGAADGMDVEDIQAGLRHKSLSTTLRHYMPGHNGRDVAAKAIQAFNEIEDVAA